MKSIQERISDEEERRENITVLTGIWFACGIEVLLSAVWISLAFSYSIPTGVLLAIALPSIIAWTTYVLIQDHAR